MVLANHTQTLTRKTIDGDDNTLTDINITSLKNTGATDVFVTKDNSGDPAESKGVPSGTVVGDSDTQVLSNKTLTSPILNEIVETGTGDTYTLPNHSGGTDRIVSRTSTDTLTNKTLTLGTASRATKTDGSGNLIVSVVTDTELEYLDGVTSSIQTQIDTKQADVITTRGDTIIGNASNVASRLPIGGSGTVLTSDGTDVSWDAPAGTGDVTAASNLTDNALVRGNGGAKGIQDSGILIDDSDNISGLGWVTHDTLIDNNKTFTTGTSTFHPGPTIDTGTTITINSGAVLVTGDGIVKGTIINNGTHKVL